MITKKQRIKQLIKRLMNDITNEQSIIRWHQGELLRLKKALRKAQDFR